MNQIEFYEANTTYSVELINEAALLYWKKMFSRTFFISLCLVILALLLIFNFNSKNWITGTFLAISMTSSVIYVWAYFIYRNRSMSIFKELGSPVIKWKFTEENISTESDLGKSEFKWNLLENIIKSNNFWLLIYKNSSYSVFPLSDVSKEVLEFLSRKVELNGGKVT